jgi:hypothetical protein
MHFGINKLVISLCFSLGCYSLFSQPRLSLVGPNQARIGISTTAKVQIISSSIHGPARASIDIPQGWSLENYPGESASVSQTGSQIKIVWLEFPIRDTLEVVFLLKIPESANKGTYAISGYFDYISEGKAKKLAIPAHSYKVLKYYTRVQ